MSLAGSRGQYPYHKGKHLMILLHAFGDASDSPEFLVLSGYIASPEQWQPFDNAWAAVLETAHVPEFHSKDFFPLRRRAHVIPYCNWSPAEATEFLGQLLEIIDRYRRRIKAIGRAVNVPDFQAVPHDDRRLLTGGSILLHNRMNRRQLSAKWKAHGAPSRPYFLAFQWFLEDALNLAKGNATIHFVFDEEKHLKARAIETFSEVKRFMRVWRPGPPFLGDTTFADSKSKAGLQAADMHAYLWHRWLIGAELTEDMALAMKTIFRNKATMGVFDAESFAAFRPLLLEEAQRRIAAALERQS